ncbi:odorant receptor 49b-like [Diabrotica undecimpunctata]|uniref:odorant receptor 49b-like n=1 Tax=Diabrotica undecimpunctata TaxID=50387 RepID=UPI003B637E4F
MVPMLHLFKGPAMCYNIKKMELLVEQILQHFWPYDLLGGHSQEYIESLFSHIYILQLLFCLLGFFYTVTILPSPILMSSEKSLPFPVKFDFDHTVSPVYEIIYFLQCFFLVFTVAFTGIGIDLYVLAICACAGSQFRLIGHCFSTLGTPAVHTVNRKLENIFADEYCGEQNENRKIFIRCVKHQERLFRFVKDVNEALNFIELGQLILSVIGLCLDAFILSSNPTTLQFFMASLLALGFGFQLLLDCIIGTEMFYQANLIPEYLFKSDWWNLDIQLKKDVAFVLQHSQRVQQLSAYKLYDMNMTSWIKVLKLAFSLFTVLNTVLK